MSSAAVERMLSALQGDGLGWLVFEEEVWVLRESAAGPIGAQIALLPNASIGAWHVASTLAWQVHPGIVCASLELPFLGHVWLARATRSAQAKWFEAAGTDQRIVASCRKAIGAKTRLVRVPLVSYLEGRRLPVERCAGVERNTGTWLFVDAYQVRGRYRSCSTV